jgi:hypothetical protein
MRLTLVIALLATAALAIVWLTAGRSVTSLADRFIVLSVPTAKIGALKYDGGGLRVGGLSLTFGALNNLPFALGLHANAANLVVLTSGGRSFILVPRTSPADTSGRPDMSFVAERGDELSLNATRSLLGWPTPFEYNIMTRTPSWKRYVYYRLTWKKRSGAELAMFWRYEQDYLRGSGWTEPLMMWNSHTGLLQTDIHP